MRIKSITPQSNHTLKIITETGLEGFFNISPYLNCEAFKPLHNMTEFNKIINGKYFVEWECGADLSSDTIESKLELIRNTQKTSTV